jgi:lipoprotein-anchoring transpeptidase ErfK/SrfK
VDISEQLLYLYCSYADGKEEVKTYPVSTAKAGIGNKKDSNKTPLGRHKIQKKIGDGEPIGRIFKGRQPTKGKITKMNVSKKDYVLTRIMRLKGLEEGKNSGKDESGTVVDSYERFIYIHGTPAENKIGTPASLGCVRMYNSDVIDLFDLVNVGTEVNIEE